jgi:hypothetical protein
MFHWYHVNGDGTADRVDDCIAVRACIDAGEPGWFGNPEGAILHGGVAACAFKRKTETVYDAAAWLATGAMVPAGEITTTEITASREA